MFSASIAAKAQWLDSISVINKNNLSSNDTIIVRAFGYLGDSGWGIDTSWTSINGSSIEITIKACYQGVISIPMITLFNLNKKIVPQNIGTHNLKVRIIGHIPFNSVPCSSVITRDSLMLNLAIAEPNTVREIEYIKNYKLFPSPVSNQLNFEIDEIKDEIRKISIYNLLGQEVYEINYFSKSKGIDVSGLEKGVYFLYAQLRSGNIQHKFIKD